MKESLQLMRVDRGSPECDDPPGDLSVAAALRAVNESDFQASDTTFAQNTANGFGGAVYVDELEGRTRRRLRVRHYRQLGHDQPLILFSLGDARWPPS